jgi:hypothetical protein
MVECWQTRKHASDGQCHLLSKATCQVVCDPLASMCHLPMLPSLAFRSSGGEKVIFESTSHLSKMIDSLKLLSRPRNI